MTRHSETEAAIRTECEQITELLLEKNRAYGDSAFNPIRIFSTADPQEQLCVRIDDKLSRLAQGHPADDEDTTLDLIGYLILLRVHTRLMLQPALDILGFGDDYQPRRVPRVLGPDDPEPPPDSIVITADDRAWQRERVINAGANEPTWGHACAIDDTRWTWSELRQSWPGGITLIHEGDAETSSPVAQTASVNDLRNSDGTHVLVRCPDGRTLGVGDLIVTEAEYAAMPVGSIVTESAEDEPQTLWFKTSADPWMQWQQADPSVRTSNENRAGVSYRIVRIGYDALLGAGQ